MQSEQWIDDLMAWLKEAEGGAAGRLDAEIASRRRQLAVLEAVRRAVGGEQQAGAPPASASGREGAQDGPVKPPAPDKQPLIDRTRLKVARAILAGGPAHRSQLRARAGVAGGSTLSAALEHPWFERQTDGWHLTAEGAAALRDAGEQEADRAEEAALQAAGKNGGRPAGATPVASQPKYASPATLRTAREKIAAAIRQHGRSAPRSSRPWSASTTPPSTRRSSATGSSARGTAGT